MADNYNLFFKELRGSFSAIELDELCLELGYDGGEVFSQPGNVSRMAQDLQGFAKRRGQEQQLMTAVATLRPHLDLTPYGYKPNLPPGPGRPPLPNTLPPPPALREKKVFVSYAWGGDSENIVNQIDQSFKERGIALVRDKRDLGFKGLIREFMQEIGAGQAIVVVLSDKYLRSKNCMFELVEIANHNNFYARIFPVVLPDAKIYDAIDRIEYIKYWDDKIRQLNEAMKSIDSQAYLQGIREDVDLYTRIRNTIAGLMDILQNMNTLTADMHQASQFEELYTAVEQKLVE
ncbi:MAG: TIR domain-containing protein [Anaerolineae bacterium]|nr:TIR domain-containing protein [Anaerolineae bacterium]